MLLKVVGTVAGWLASLALLTTFAFFFLLYFNGLYGGGPALWGDRAPVMIASLVIFGVAYFVPAILINPVFIKRSPLGRTTVQRVLWSLGLIMILWVVSAGAHYSLLQYVDRLNAEEAASADTAFEATAP